MRTHVLEHSSRRSPATRRRSCSATSSPKTALAWATTSAGWTAITRSSRGRPRRPDGYFPGVNDREVLGLAPARSRRPSADGAGGLEGFSAPTERGRGLPRHWRRTARVQLGGRPARQPWRRSRPSSPRRSGRPSARAPPARAGPDGPRCNTVQSPCRKRSLPPGWICYNPILARRLRPSTSARRPPLARTGPLVSDCAP